MDVSLLDELEKQANALSNRMDHLRVLRSKGALKFNEWMEFFRLREKLHGIYVKLINPKHLVIYDVKVWGFQYSKQTNVGKLIRTLSAKGLLYEIDRDAKTIKFYNKGKLQLPVRTLDVAVVSGITAKPHMAPIELKTNATLLREAPAELVSDNFRSGGKRKRLGDQLAKEKWLKQLAKDNKVTYIIYEGKNIDGDRPTVNKIPPDNVKLSAPTSYTKPGKALFDRIRQTLRPKKTKAPPEETTAKKRPKLPIEPAGNAKEPAGKKGRPKLPIAPTRIAIAGESPKYTFENPFLKRPSVSSRGVDLRPKTAPKSAASAKSGGRGATGAGGLKGRRGSGLGRRAAGGIGTGLLLLTDLVWQSYLQRQMDKWDALGDKLDREYGEKESQRIQKAIQSKQTFMNKLLRSKKKDIRVLIGTGKPIVANITMELEFQDVNRYAMFFRHKDDSPFRWSFNYISRITIEISDVGVTSSMDIIKRGPGLLPGPSVPGKDQSLQRLRYSVNLLRGMTEQERKLSNRLGTIVYIDHPYTDQGLPQIEGLSLD